MIDNGYNEPLHATKQRLGDALENAQRLYARAQTELHTAAAAKNEYIQTGWWRILHLDTADDDKLGRLIHAENVALEVVLAARAGLRKARIEWERLTGVPMTAEHELDPALLGV